MSRNKLVLGLMIFLNYGFTSFLFAQEKTEAAHHSVFSNFTKFSGEKDVNLDKGRNIIAMFSLDCESCMETAKQLGEMNAIEKLPPIYFIFLGTEEQVDDFFSIAQCRFAYLILDPSKFFDLLNAPYPPRVCVLDDGKITADFKAGNEFTKENLKNVLTKKKNP